jgi:hypothetical protein
MCKSCRNFYEKEAIYQGRDIHVNEPGFTKTFFADGRYNSAVERK